MPPKGVENVEAIISSCQKTIGSLGSPEHKEWKEWIESAIDVLGDMKDKFFLKTNPSIPVTNKCRKDAEELATISTDGSMDQFPAVFERFQADMDTLLKRSSMDGVIIT